MKQARIDLKVKDDRVLRSEYRLMDRKEKKLLGAVEKDNQRCEKHRKKIEIVFEDEMALGGGYYSRHILKELSKAAVKNKPPAEEAQTVSRIKSALKDGPSVKSVKQLRESLLKNSSCSKQPSDPPAAVSSSNRKVTFHHCNTHPNTSEYVRRILESTAAYQSIRSNRHPSHCLQPPTDQNLDKSVDRRKPAAEEYSDNKSELQSQNQNRPEVLQMPSTADRSMKRSASAKALNSKQNRRRAAAGNDRSRLDGDHRGDMVDLAEYIQEEEQQWRHAQAHQDGQSRTDHYLTPQQSQQLPASRPATRRSQNNLQHSGSTFGGASSIVQPVIKPIHPKQTSFENALKLREGKIFAKINEELKIYDIRDLDCRVSVAAELLLKNRSQSRSTAAHQPHAH